MATYVKAYPVANYVVKAHRFGSLPAAQQFLACLQGHVYSKDRPADLQRDTAYLV
jgi:hypothetical protein